MTHDRRRRAAALRAAARRQEHTADPEMVALVRERWILLLEAEPEDEQELLILEELLRLYQIEQITARLATDPAFALRFGGWLITIEDSLSKEAPEASPEPGEDVSG